MARRCREHADCPALTSPLFAPDEHPCEGAHPKLQQWDCLPCRRHSRGAGALLSWDCPVGEICSWYCVAFRNCPPPPNSFPPPPTREKITVQRPSRNYVMPCACTHA